MTVKACSAKESPLGERVVTEETRNPQMLVIATGQVEVI